MSDKFAYRVSVRGPDLDEYIRRVEATRVPRDPSDSLDMYEWSGPKVRGASTQSNRPSPMTISGHWFNTTTTVLDTPEGRAHRLLGNFSSAPVWYFVREGTKRGVLHRMDGGPFDDLVLFVEIVGMSLACDVPGGKYSYRTVINDGRIGEDDGWTSVKTAKTLAPELHAFATAERR